MQSPSHGPSMSALTPYAPAAVLRLSATGMSNAPSSLGMGPTVHSSSSSCAPFHMRVVREAHPVWAPASQAGRQGARQASAGQILTAQLMARTRITPLRASCCTPRRLQLTLQQSSRQAVMQAGHLSDDRTTAKNGEERCMRKRRRRQSTCLGSRSAAPQCPRSASAPAPPL
jgi:hypothetical protein